MEVAGISMRILVTAAALPAGLPSPALREKVEQ
jgi:hypothetical protein